MAHEDGRMREKPKLRRFLIGDLKKPEEGLRIGVTKLPPRGVGVAC